MPRRVWAKRGRRPVAPVHPASGAVEWFLGYRVNTALFAAVPARFAAAVGAGAGKAVILVLDGAGWHASERLAVPAGVRLVFQPPSGPELQPAERLRPLAREAVADATFASLADLDRARAARCLALADRPDLVASRTHIHWWPDAA